MSRYMFYQADDDSPTEVSVWRTLQTETSDMLARLSTLEGPSQELSEVSDG